MTTLLRIRYTGIEALPSSIHTREEFLYIMHNRITTHPLVLQLIKEGMLFFKGYRLPKGFKQFTLEDWMDFAGASHIIC
uniref:Uncharacterized protein n=1 Tax=viral metagenome TaxID=1070528 RepID=A0A6C0IKK8_9ZZZZ